MYIIYSGETRESSLAFLLHRIVIKHRDFVGEMRPTFDFLEEFIARTFSIDPNLSMAVQDIIRSDVAAIDPHLYEGVYRFLLIIRWKFFCKNRIFLKFNCSEEKKATYASNRRLRIFRYFDCYKEVRELQPPTNLYLRKLYRHRPRRNYIRYRSNR